MVRTSTRQAHDRQQTRITGARTRERRKDQTVVGGKNPRGWVESSKRESDGGLKKGRGTQRVSPWSRLDADPIDGCPRHATPGLDPRPGLRGSPAAATATFLKCAPEFRALCCRRAALRMRRGRSVSPPLPAAFTVVRTASPLPSFGKLRGEFSDLTQTSLPSSSPSFYSPRAPLRSLALSRSVPLCSLTFSLPPLFLSLARSRQIAPPPLHRG